MKQPEMISPALAHQLQADKVAITEMAGGEYQTLGPAFFFFLLTWTLVRPEAAFRFLGTRCAQDQI
jgi:hypothetical protein